MMNEELKNIPELKRFKQERINARQLFPFPEQERVVEENPPCLSWLPVPGVSEYCVAVYNDRGQVVWSGKTEKNAIVPDVFLEAGTYFWNIFANDEERGIQSFMIAENAVKIHRTTAEKLYDSVPDEHPRHLFTANEKQSIIGNRQKEITVLKRNIEQAYRDGMPEGPRYHWDENALPYREYFGRFRDYCDRNLVACSLGYSLLGDEKAGAFARQLLLTICDWNPTGPCSLLGAWGDEVGLSCARCLPAVYDMLYPILSDRERNFVAKTVKAYAEQCWERLKKLDYCTNPGDSHAGRIPAYLGEAAMVLKGSGVQTREEALRWLDYALDIYGGIFPYFGTPDGGWAEGVFYATSYTKWYLPFFCAVERYTGCRFLDRPFYQRLSQYFLHFANAEYENHPFCDGYWCKPEDPEWPGFFAQNPMRVYADRFGPEEARERRRKADEQDLYLLHLLDVFLPDGTPPENCLTGEAKNVQAFRDAGFVSMHTDLIHTEIDLAVMARASKFGSGSHRHPDEGSFALFYKGTALISPSGYFGRQYGTKHHREWLNSTRAHNAILIDGEGQQPNSHLDTGRILFCTETKEGKKAVLDLSKAYPMLKKWVRTLVLTEGRLLIRDHVEADHPVRVTYPLHTLSEPKNTTGEEVSVVRNGIELTIRPLKGGLKLEEITDRFAVDLNEGEPEAYHVTMPQQYHIRYEAPAAEIHDLEVEYIIGERQSANE